MLRMIDSRIFLFGVVVIVSIGLIAGCGLFHEPVSEPVVEEVADPDPVTEEEGSAEEPAMIVTYYWPWVSHGQVELSSGEIIIGPDLFESDHGFIGEFTVGSSYDGRLLWRVDSTDLFLLEWVSLTFDVDYYNQAEWESSSTFYFRIDDLQPEPGDEGLQHFTVNISERHEDFEVKIKQVLLGKEEEGSIAAEPLNYIAFDIEMTVIDNP
ncbi:MAG: hypothetical protein ACNA7Z_07105 [Dethiobacteria bacterium]|nr:hypothetical protein [Bacillota bacterium]